MQRNSDRANNPINPLIKVVALDMHKSIQEGTPSSGKLFIDLSLKEGTYVQGTTDLKDGTKAVVSFDMSMRKIELQVNFIENDGVYADNCLRISDVAYANAAEAKGVKRVSKSTDFDTSIDSHLRGDASLQSRMYKPANAAVSVGGGASMKRSQHNRVTETKESAEYNINVNFDRNQIIWDIAVEGGSDQNGSHFLKGNFFLKPSGCARAACTLKRTDKKALNNVTANGSIYVNFRDVNLCNITITDLSGNPLSIVKVKGMQGDLAIFDRSKAKKTLLKEIIRKHLRDEGMNDSESLIQVSRAGSRKERATTGRQGLMTCYNARKRIYLHWSELRI